MAKIKRSLQGGDKRKKDYMILGGDGRHFSQFESMADLFLWLTPYIEKAGYKWSLKEYEHDGTIQIQTRK